jgi:hypothetical protein
MSKRKSALRTEDSILIPRNPLIVDTNVVETIEHCKGVISWLAHIEQPFAGDGELAAAEAHILHMVSDALEFAQAVLEDRAESRAEVNHG